MTLAFERLATQDDVDLSSREKAFRLRRKITQVAQENPPFELDCGQVRSMSHSFADELFGVLIAQFGLDWFRSHVSLTNLSPEVRLSILEAIDLRLNLQRSSECRNQDAG